MPVSKISNAVKKTYKELAGRWAIISMDEFDDDYFDMGNERPHLVLEKPDKFQNIRGEYVIGLSNGAMDGALREFGGETLIIFGYEGMDEMDPVSGGGWIRLTSANTLEGEFMGSLGRFVARRRRPPKRRE